ncbi:SHOCT domain-containing protein [Halorubrum vacuolatum]|uniref:SHOCT domain-containing protein n=1 Tax=Halorubrum vacuolatum TaxID=63740 RepID=UPI001FE78A0A|nr:SHOCT domain-containing protein [Halorubrum vacuolatum]
MATSEDSHTPLETAVIALTVVLGILAAAMGWGSALLVILLVGFLVFLPMASRISNDSDNRYLEAIEQWLDVTEGTEEMEDESKSSESTPVETLRERYARGEIDEGEFTRRVERLIATEEIPEYAIQDSGESTSVETLREQYACGEIDEGEFDRGVRQLIATEELTEYPVQDTGSTQKDTGGTANAHETVTNETKRNQSVISEDKHRVETETS